MSVEADFFLGDRKVTNGGRPYIIAEIAQAHDGSLGLAHSYIDAAARAGADAVKFQTHIAQAESTIDEPFRVNFSLQDKTRFDYWRRMEFSPSEWGGLAQHANEMGLGFISSVFSLEAFDVVSKLNPVAWKIASGEVFSDYLLAPMLQTGLPIIASSGMSDWKQIEAFYSYAQKHQTSCAILQCTTRYPTPLEEVGLNVVSEMQRRFDCPIGLSDHSGQVWPGLAAVSRGVAILEVHLVFNKNMFGPDASSSLTEEELRILCDARDAIYFLDQHPVDKDEISAQLTDLRKAFSRSVALVEDQPAGTVLTREMMTLKKPSTGIPEENIEKLVGRKLIKNVEATRLLREEDLI